jgi:hypothetical protein
MTFDGALIPDMAVAVALILIGTGLFVSGKRNTPARLLAGFIVLRGTITLFRRLVLGGVPFFMGQSAWGDELELLALPILVAFACTYFLDSDKQRNLRALAVGVCTFGGALILGFSFTDLCVISCRSHGLLHYGPLGVLVAANPFFYALLGGALAWRANKGTPTTRKADFLLALGFLLEGAADGAFALGILVIPAWWAKPGIYFDVWGWARTLVRPVAFLVAAFGLANLLRNYGSSGFPSRFKAPLVAWILVECAVALVGGPTNLNFDWGFTPFFTTATAWVGSITFTLRGIMRFGFALLVSGAIVAYQLFDLRVSVAQVTRAVAVAIAVPLSVVASLLLGLGLNAVPSIEAWAGVAYALTTVAILAVLLPFALWIREAIARPSIGPSGVGLDVLIGAILRPVGDVAGEELASRGLPPARATTYEQACTIYLDAALEEMRRGDALRMHDRLHAIQDRYGISEVDAGRLRREARNQLQSPKPA